MKTTKIKCAHCGKIVEKRAAEIKRQKAKGRTEFYCDLSCHGKATAHYVISNPGYGHSNGGPKKNKFTPFRWYLRRCKSSNKKLNLTLEYLKELWESQYGTCPFTGWKLTLREFTDNRRARPDDASLDRIDNSKGYVKGNVRFVSLMFNMARNSWTDDQVIGFCKKVTENV